MPWAAPRACTTPGCPGRAARRGPCPACEAKRKAGVDARRGSAAQRQYTSSEWRRTRTRVLARDPVCCVAGCGQPSTDVDHVVPRAAGGSDDDSNLRGLCHRHHSAKTAARDRGFGNRSGGSVS